MSYSDQDFQPYLDKIEEIDMNVTELEKTVVLLDEYSKRLGILLKFIGYSSSTNSTI